MVPTPFPKFLNYFNFLFWIVVPVMTPVATDGDSTGDFLRVRPVLIE